MVPARRSFSRPTRDAAHLKAHAIHPAEKILAGVLALWVVFQPWAIGTRDVWSQSIALALAALAFALSLYPRLIDDGRAAVAPRRFAPWRVLVRLPLFWLGLAVFAYVAIQALNPGWAWRQSTTHWWLERQPAIAWLPAGVEAPFERMNAWRKLFIWASPFLAGCALWIGVTRRRLLQGLLVTFVLNAVLVGIYALVQQAAKATKIYWHFDFPGAAFFGPFVYKNHAAAYLIVAFAAACGLGLAFYLRGAARGARSTPAPVFAFLAVILATAAVFSLSRLGALLVGLAALLFAVGTLWALFRRGAGNVWLPLAGGLVLAAAAGWAATQFDTTKVEKGFERLAQGVGESSPKIRVYSYHLTTKMIADHPAFGIGAGGFRYLSSSYGKEFPTVFMDAYFWRTGKHVKPAALNETHNELLEFAAEFGLVGGALVAAVLAWIYAAVCAAARHAHPLGIAAAVGFVCLLLFAVLDFPWHNPAVVSALTLLGVVSVRWAEMEEVEA